MSVKLADTLAPMADFPAAMAEHIEFDDGENLQEKLDNGSLGGGAGYDSFIKLTGTMGYHHYAREFSYSDIQTVFDTGNTNSPGYGLTLEKVESNQTNLITALTRVETIKDKKFTCSGTTSIDLMQNGILHFSSQDFEQPYEMLIEWNNPLIDDENISTETTWSSEKILIETAENYAIFEGVIGDSYYSTNIGNDDITSTPASLYGGWTLDAVTSNGDIESILSNYNNATIKRVISFSDILRVYDISDTSISLEDTTKNSGGQPYKFILVWENDSKESGSKTYTTLDELGLTADATFQDVVDILPKGDSALLGVKEFTNYQTIFPYEEGNDQFARVYIVKGIADGSCMYARWFRKDGVKEAIAIFNINDNKFDGWRILKDQQIYTSLTELGLTADATVENVVSALKNGESFLAPVNTFTNYETIFPNKVPNDQWNKVHIVKGTSLASSHIRCFSPSGTSEYLANINGTSIVGWIDVSGTYIDISDAVIEKLGTEILKYPVGKYRINSTTIGNKFTDLPSGAQMKCGLIEINGTAVGKSPFTDAWVYRMYKFEILNGSLIYTRRLNSGATAGQIEVDTGWCVKHNIYTSLKELGLDTTATINDIINAMTDGSVLTYKTDVFDYATEYNNIQYGTVTIHKQSGSRIQVLMTDKDTGNLYVGKLDNNNKVVGWRNETFHRIVTQATAGYFKFKPTSTGIDQPLRISVTDNYGGMINISGATPTASQYKPFKCIRLSNGEYTNYDAMKVANNKMLKLFYYDGYCYLKVTTYTTCTFTGLLEAPTYVETFDETDAEEIPIRSVFDTPYNDGYADPSIIAIGDTASADGVIKTLNSLGFTGDVMTWDTGEYRISHVAGLTNLPTEITEEKPGFRLAHYDVKKWGSNHNPYVSTYGCRQSVLHYKGNIFVRYTESGANAGVLIADTSWRKINTNNSTTLVTNTSTLKLDVTKKNTAWYGAIKLTYLYDTSPVELEIDFKSATDTLKWTISKGQKYIKKVTYTQDSSNKAHYTIGIEFSGTTYGCYQAEVIGGFADINSLTADAFTGDTTAVYGNPYGKNNGVTLISAPEDLGLTSPCTTVQLVQAMRNTFNKTITAGAIGVFNNGGNTITDAPSDYGLLHIEVFGHDRVMIRYDGIGGSSYNGSWTGQVVGNNGTFSEVTFERENNIYSTGEEVIGTWIDGSTIYRKVLSISSIDAKTSSSTVELGDAPVSGQNMLKIEGFLNLIGNQCFIHYPNVADENEYINATLSIANGHVKLTGTWKYPISKGAIIMEYLKS